MVKHSKKSPAPLFFVYPYEISEGTDLETSMFQKNSVAAEIQAIENCNYQDNAPQYIYKLVPVAVLKGKTLTKYSA